MSSKQTTNLASINSTQLKAFPIRRPEVAEQLRITERLTKLDGRIGIEQRQLNKLRKLKSGLMHDLLTGKVRVKVDEESVA